MGDYFGYFSKPFWPMQQFELTGTLRLKWIENAEIMALEKL
jgi:hypothetical protein